jgi:hypothetical protein
MDLEFCLEPDLITQWHVCSVAGVGLQGVWSRCRARVRVVDGVRLQVVCWQRTPQMELGQREAQVCNVEATDCIDSTKALESLCRLM